MIINRVLSIFRRPRFSQKILLELIEKYNLEGKIDLKISARGEHIFVPIISEQGEVPQIPGEFLREYLFCLFQGKSPWQRSWRFLKIGPPRTLKSIQAEVNSINLSAELCWQAIDG